MTDKEFCKLDTEFYGEKIDNIKQIGLRSFDGEALKEYVEHCINLLNNPIVRNCPFCNNSMEGIKLTHYKCNKCNEYFTD